MILSVPKVVDENDDDDDDDDGDDNNGDDEINIFPFVKSQRITWMRT